jgi:phosphoribosylamine--glycine ligase
MLWRGVYRNPRFGKRWKAFCRPGNPGIAEHAQLVTLDVTDHGAVLAFAMNIRSVSSWSAPKRRWSTGWAMRCARRAPVFGPNKLPAQLEGSKGFTKDLCARANIPTAGYQRVTSLEQALAAGPIRRAGGGQGRRSGPGKGVTVAMTMDEAQEAVRDIFAGRFGDAEAVIEEFMEGEEASSSR